MTDITKHHSTRAVVERDVAADGGRAVVEWTGRARTLRGEPYENFCIGAFTVRDGKIQTVREYMETAYAQGMLFDRGRAAA